MIIKVDNNCDNEDKNLPDEITLEDLEELFSDIDIAITPDLIRWEFERKLRKRNIL